MKITKYPQSCFILEKEGKRLIIDPGNFVEKKYTAEDLPVVDGILVTHHHSDHMASNLIAALRRDGGVPLIANADVATKLGEGAVSQVVSDGNELELSGFQLRTFDRPHMLLPDGSVGPPNTAFLVDEKFFHGGDTADVVGIRADTAAIPIAGPDMSPRIALSMAKTLGAQTMIPMHYDKITSDPQLFVDMAAKFGMPFKVLALKDGESLEI